MVMCWCHSYRTVVQERQFEAICQRILNAKTHIADGKEYLIQMKRNKPKPVSHPVRIFRPDCTNDI